MSIKTKIEWCDSSVNPIMGCTGCTLREKHCYAAVLCTRYAGCKGWPKSFDEPEFFPGRLEKAIRWSDLSGTERPDKPWLNGRPRIIFVNDLSDGFCPDVDAWGWLLPRIDAMAESPHTWLLLTKWPDRMREFFASLGGAPGNFWLGTSVLSQDDEWRIDELLRIQGAAVRFVSVEPMLGAIQFRPMWIVDAEERREWGDMVHPCLDWVICGGESGPGARPMHPDWARSLRDQCQEAGVPYFFKNWGAWFPRSQWEDNPGLVLPDDCDCIDGPSLKIIDGDTIHRVGKKAAGRLLDGREWSEMPEEAR